MESPAEETLELVKELPRSSSCSRRSREGRGVVSVVDNEDTRSCSYAALDRSEESNEKLFVWCLNVAGRRAG